VSVDEEDYFSNLGSSERFLSSALQRTRDEQLEKEMLENRQKSEELQSFIEDQVAQVFQTYLRDYFQKESAFLRWLDPSLPLVYSDVDSNCQLF
jgi:hypothetical protein